MAMGYGYGYGAMPHDPILGSEFLIPSSGSAFTNAMAIGYGYCLRLN